MISLKEYWGKYATSSDITPEIRANAERLLNKVNRLIAEGEKKGVKFAFNAATNSQIGGSGNGGFRPQDCPIGAPQSAHKQGCAVDLFDPRNEIDHWLNDPHTMALIVELDIYMEAQIATIGWAHISIKAPRSGRRFFNP